MAYSSGGAGLAPAPSRAPVRDPFPQGHGRPGAPPARTNKNRPSAPPPRGNQPQQGHTGHAGHVSVPITPINPHQSPAQRRGGNANAGQSTNPLAPLSPGQIRRQASSTISKAYAGDFSDLNNQQKQAQNLYKTQTADDAYFNQWLSQQAQSMQAQTDTVNQKLLDVVNGIRQSQSDSLSAIPGQLATSAGTQGTGVQPGQQTAALTAETAPMINAANAQTANAAAHAGAYALSGNQRLAGAGQVALGRIQQIKAAQLTDLNKTLTSIAGERTKLMASRTGDIAKEIARLNGIEISKAQYQQSQAALEQKLGIAQQTANAGTLRAKTGVYNAQTQRARSIEQQRHNQQMETINSTHYANQNAHDAAVAAETNRHNKAMEGISQQNANTRAQNAGANGPAGKGFQIVNGRRIKVATPAQQMHLRTQIGAIRNALIWDINTYHQGDPNALKLAWHDLENGNYMAARNATKDAAGKVTPGPRIPINYDVGLVNAASNTLTQYGAVGLSPGDVAFLETQGMNNLGGYYPLAPKAQRTGGGPRGGIGNRG